MAIDEVGKVVAIWRYPVSSLMGERLQRARFAQEGLSGDRAFAIFDDETQLPVDPAKARWYDAPKLASRTTGAGEIEISLDGETWLPAADARLKERLSSFFGRQVSVHRYGARLSSTVASHRYKLSPIHLLSTQSIEALRTLLPDSLIDERRFRPNILVDLEGLAGGEPPENRLLGKEFRIGGLRLRGSLPCGRCSFTTRAQQQLPEDRSVLRTLIGRFEKNFGIYCDVIGGDWLEVADPVLADVSRAPVVVIGAGQAGGTVARSLRDLGYTGKIELYGDEAHSPYERPPLSKNFALSQELQTPLTRVLSSADAEALGIDLHLAHSVVHIDRQAKTIETSDGAEHPYDKLVIATGGTARQVPSLNRGYGRVHRIRTADDAEKLAQGLRNAQKIFILGGGWLGLEVAAAARQAGIEVDLFARDAHLCSKVLPSIVAAYLADVHRDHGVRLHLGCAAAFREHPDHVEASIAGRVERADLLVVAIGITPNDFLARRAGLECRDGVLTDGNGATADPDVFAVGDVSRQSARRDSQGLRIESWQNAIEQANRAARAIMGLPPEPAPALRFWSDQYDLMIQIAGMPDPASVPEAIEAGTQPFWRFPTFAIGINRPREIRRFASELQKAGLEPRIDEAAAPAENAAPATKHFLCALPDLPDEPIVPIPAPRIGEIVLVRQGGKFFAIQEKCPHADASLAEGFLEEGHIVCPLHFAEFDLVDGRARNAPKGCANAMTYKVEAEGTDLFIWIPD